jgi:hypothetical protein
MRGHAFLVAAALGLGLGGCGVLKAIVNPSAAWSIGESTPMAVVVRRAEVARGIVDQVDRLVGETPIDEAAAKALTLTAADAQKRLEAAAAEPVYAGGAEPMRVVPAEAWLSTFAGACAADGSASTLIGLLGADVAKQYAEVASRGKKIAELGAQIVALEEKSGAEGTTDAQREENDRAIAELKAQIDELETTYGPAADALLEAVRTAASQAPADAKTTMSPVVFNLREAVEDARNANSAAVLRYPMAIPSLTDDLPATVKRYAADVVEDQTGHRPDMNGLSPAVSLKGTDVEITLNGIPAEKLGAIEPGALVEETTERTTHYVERTVTLLGYLDQTETRLAFQADLLDAWSSGLAAEPDSTPGVVDITDLEVVTTPGAAPKPAAASAGTKSKTAKRSLAGLRFAACAAPAKAVAKAAPPAAPPPSAQAAKTTPKPKAAPKGSPPPRPSPVRGEGGATTTAATRSDASPAVQGARYRDLPGEGAAPERMPGN